MISVKEAYDLSAPNVDTYRAFIDKRIREAASTGKLKIEIRDDPYNMWLYGADAVTKLAKKDACAAKVIRELKDLGYSVRQYYDDSTYFVDVALVINWEKQKNPNDRRMIMKFKKSGSARGQRNGNAETLRAYVLFMPF